MKKGNPKSEDQISVIENAENLFDLRERTTKNKLLKKNITI